MSQTLQVSHVGFADESHWNIGRFRSLGLVSTSVHSLDSLEGELHRLLKESGVSEFKWKELDGAKERFAAIKMCEFATENAIARKLRVDPPKVPVPESGVRSPGSGCLIASK